jgi:hypothetical protein
MRVPDKPAKPTATAMVLFDIVKWSAVNDNGSPLIEYEWESSDGKTGTTTSLGVTLAQEGSTAQTYRVRARNSIGYGPWSDDSGSVTTVSPFFPFFPFFPTSHHISHLTSHHFFHTSRPISHRTSHHISPRGSHSSHSFQDSHSFPLVVQSGVFMKTL